MDEKDVDFTKPWTYSDVIFKIGDQQIHASKTVLGLASPVFNKMFSAKAKEENATEIPLPGKKIESFVELMKVVHYRHRITSNYFHLLIMPQFMYINNMGLCQKLLVSTYIQ